MQKRTLVLSLLLAAICFSATAYANDLIEKAKGYLEGKGLKLQSGSYVLPDESEFSKLANESTDQRRKTFAAAKKVTEAEKQVEGKKQMLAAMANARTQLRARLSRPNISVRENNTLVSQLDELVDRMNAIDADETVMNQLREARGELNTLREEYVSTLLKMRSMADQTTAKYDDLNADPKVKLAFDYINKDAEKATALGPSRVFQASVRKLQGQEETVLSEAIPLRLDESDSFYCSAVFNQSYNTELCVDTGASIVMLPWKTAEELKMLPGADAEAITLQLADGRLIEGKRVIAKSLRVGKFVVENVECVVLEQSAVAAEPLLGMSFLKNFSFKLETDKKQLVMTRVDTPGSDVKTVEE